MCFALENVADHAFITVATKGSESVLSIVLVVSPNHSFHSRPNFLVLVIFLVLYINIVHTVGCCTTVL